ncbi:MAG: HAD family phosphatase [Acidimicrobiales bacterium]|jgi:epoxide hydrolase-like predicted phosphatase|nr:HAD family phosphatase [Acidimicrobiales bacterium]MDP6900930.1 HAD family phosphatase [Acidimicrobiales bacterium]HJL99055.1 HAD family phosphatase [Acidimicrobiales bacterium]
MSPKAVIFDVGGVLLESPFLAALRWAEQWDIPLTVLKEVFGDYARRIEPGEDPPIWHEVECGRIELSDFVTQMQRTFSSELPPGHKATTMTADDFNPFAEAEPVVPMLELSSELRAGGIRTAILTNNVREWRQWRDRIPLQCFEPVIDSCEVGMRKPDPNIYLLVCTQLGLAPKDCLFLDDHPENIQGALAVGLDALLVSEDCEAAVIEVQSKF